MGPNQNSTAGPNGLVILNLAKTRIGTLPEPARATTDCHTGTAWTDTPTLKTALAGGYCLRAPAQGPCTYANICEHCPSFHTEAGHATVLTAQRDQAQVLANDATARGWDSETERHLRLITRLNDLLDNAATRPNTM